MTTVTTATLTASELRPGHRIALAGPRSGVRVVASAEPSYTGGTVIVTYIDGTRERLERDANVPIRTITLL